MTRPNTAFFTPSMDNVRIGIKASRLLAPDGHERTGVVMGRKNEIHLRGRRHFQADPKNASVTWVARDSRPWIKNGIVLAASFLKLPQGNGVKQFIAAPDGKGNALVMTLTGLSGDPDAWFSELAKRAQDGVQPLAHGAFALDPGSDLVEALGAGDVTGKAHRVRWSRSSEKAGADGLLRAQNGDFWRMQEGSQILVADIFDPARVRRIVFEKGTIRSVDGGEHARATFDELEAERRAERQKAIERRKAAREAREAEAAGAADADVTEAPQTE